MIRGLVLSVWTIALAAVAYIMLNVVLMLSEVSAVLAAL